MNKRFMDFAGYYSFKPVLCKPYKPQTKGKVERAIRFLSESFLMGRKFTSLEDLNVQCLKWLEEVNSKVCKATNESPVERLKREHLLPVDKIPDYDVAETFERTVGKDSMISFESNRYSVPPKYIYQTVTVKKMPQNTIQIFYSGKFICEHRLIDGKGRFVYLPEHRKEIFKISCFTPRRRRKTKVEKLLGENYSLYGYPEVMTREVSYYAQIYSMAGVRSQNEPYNIFKGPP